MMAADLDQAYTRWAHEELSDSPRPPHEQSIAQMLDHGSISFGRFAIESLSWEKRSVFTHNRRQEELEKFKAPGLVAQKKAYFEEYYRKIRSLKGLAGDSQQAGDIIDGGSDEFRNQTAEDDGCESTLTSMNSLNDVSTISYGNCSYENPENQEKSCIPESRQRDSEATTSFSGSLGKSIDEMELERNSSNISQITHLESDSIMPYVVQPKASEMEMENRSSDVSQITQIDIDSMTQLLDLCEANLDEFNNIHMDLKPESAFHTNLKESDLLMHDECRKGLVEDCSLNAVCEGIAGEAMMRKHPSEPHGVSQPTDKVSEPRESNSATAPKDTTDPSEETKIVIRPSEARMKKSTTPARSNLIREPSNRPGTSSGNLAKSKMNQGFLNRPGSSRSHQGPRNLQGSGVLARNTLNQGLYGRPGSSRSHQPHNNRQEVGTSGRNSTNQESNNQPGSSMSLKGSGSQQVSSQLPRNGKNQGPSISNRPGSSRSLQGLSYRPGSSKSLQRPKNLLHRTSDEEGKVASSSNKNRTLGSDASSCATPKQVHSKVTIPQPFSFATEKRATNERKITDASRKGVQCDSSNDTARRSATPLKTRSLSSSLNTPKKTAAVKENTVENRRQQTPRNSSATESRLTSNGASQLRKPVHRSINLPASAESIGKHSTGPDKKEEKLIKTPLAKTNQSFKDGESVIKTPKPEARKVTSSQPAHAVSGKTPRQEVKRWR